MREKRPAADNLDAARGKSARYAGEPVKVDRASRNWFERIHMAVGRKGPVSGRNPRRYPVADVQPIQGLPPVALAPLTPVLSGGDFFCIGVGPSPAYTLPHGKGRKS